MNFDPSMIVDPDVINTLVQDTDNHDGLVSSFGRYTLKNLETGRVALIPEKDNPPHVLYVIDNRLIVDDYLLPEEVAELASQGIH